MENKETPISSVQEKFILQALGNVQKLIRYKLGSIYADSMDDLSQRVFCKLWAWKQKNPQNLDYDEWQKLIKVVVYQEVADFFTEKYRKDIHLSEIDPKFEDTLFSINSLNSLNYNLEGNTAAETKSLLSLIWKGIQELSLRQRYAFILYHSDFLTEMVISQCCTTKEIAEFLEMTKEEAGILLNCLPISDDRIAAILEAKFNEKVLPNQLWEARSKAKAKLIKFLKKYSIVDKLCAIFISIGSLWTIYGEEVTELFSNFE